MQYLHYIIDYGTFSPIESVNGFKIQGVEAKVDCIQKS
jgi:hypothetical protein